MSPTADSIRSAWIAALRAHLAEHFRAAGDTRVAVRAGDGPRAPDVFVAAGRGHLPQVVFDVLVSGWRFGDVTAKFAQYERDGVEEWPLLYPEFPAHAEGYRRDAGKLVPVTDVDAHVSPRTGLRFALDRGQLTVFGRDGKSLRTAEEQVAGREEAERRAAARAAKLRELGVDPDAV